MDVNLKRRVRRWAYAAGYSSRAVSEGIAWADTQDYGDENEAKSLVMSRILYSDGQLEDGARFKIFE